MGRPGRTRRATAVGALLLPVILVVVTSNTLGGEAQEAFDLTTEQWLVPGREPRWPALEERLAFLFGRDDGRAGDRFWFGKDLLLWWIKDGPNPVPFGTTGPAPASGFTPLPGFLGQPDTRVVLGDEPASFGLRPGARFTGGFWLDDERTFGLEANYLILTGSSVTSTVPTSGRAGSPNLAVPYFDATGAALTSAFRPQNHVPGEAIWALPGSLGGFRGALGTVQQSRLQGAELNGVLPLLNTEGTRLSMLSGFRWLQLDEDLAFNVNTLGVPGGISAGSFFDSHDKFVAQNNFFGGQLGGKGEYWAGPWSFQGTAEVAFGVMRETADVVGLSRTNNGTINYQTTDTGGRVLPGGIFAQRTNGGHHAADEFAVVPEATFRVAYRITKALQVSVGYTFLFASAVARPGDMVDRRINSTLTGLADASRASGKSTIPPSGPELPGFRFHDSTFWAQGINFAVECRF